MNESENLVPKRRFKEFTNTGTWGQRKSKEICTISTGKGNTQDKIDDGKYPFYVRSATIERSNDYLYDQEAVLTVGDGVGTGKVFHYVNGKYNLHQRVYRMFDFNNEVSAKYFYYYFSKKFYRRVMAMTAKTSVDSVRLEMIADMIIEFPSPKEQQKIVKLFESLDDAIALHQRKLDKTKSLKSAYLLEMFPAEGERKPKRRFAGFTDDWEQRKLSEMTEYKNGKGHEDKQRTHGKYELINLNSISIDGGLKHSGKYIDDANETLKKYDLVMVLSDIGHGDLLGRVALIPEDNRFVLNQRVALLRPKSLFNPLFLFSYINQHQKYFKNQGAGMSQLNISRGSVESFSSYVPSAEEQTKIGTFFKQLDDTIALHQRKSTLLKQLKQTYLKQIFPQNKENIPALRFAGFSEPWKQHKFDEVFSHVQNNSLSRADLNYNGGYAMNIHYGDILIRFGEYLDVSKCKLPMIANKQLVEKYKASFLKDGDIVIADAAEDETVGKCSELRGIEDANILAGLHTIPSRPNWTFAPGYLGYYMNSSAFHDQLLPLIQGTKISSISKSALKKTDIKYPYGKEEQTKIGNLFKQLDDSISLHQSKLEKLTDLKQVLLAKMFV